MLFARILINQPMKLCLWGKQRGRRSNKYVSGSRISIVSFIINMRSRSFNSLWFCIFCLWWSVKITFTIRVFKIESNKKSNSVVMVVKYEPISIVIHNAWPVVTLVAIANFVLNSLPSRLAFLAIRFKNLANTNLENGQTRAMIG